MAKPLDAELDHEEYSPPSLYALADCRPKAQRSYYTMFSKPAPPMKDMIQFIERMEDNDDDWLVAMAKRLHSQEARERLAWTLGLELAIDCATQCADKEATTTRPPTPV